MENIKARAKKELLDVGKLIENNSEQIGSILFALLVFFLLSSRVTLSTGGHVVKAEWLFQNPDDPPVKGLAKVVEKPVNARELLEELEELVEFSPRDFAAPFVIGGQTAKMGRHPYMVNLFVQERFPMSPHCGGVLIGKKHVLTAAHCVDFRFPDLVQIGKFDLADQDENEEILKVKDVYVHPSNDFSKGFPYDVAIVELKRQSTFKPISFDVGSSFEYTDVTSLGWGKTTGSFRWGSGNPVLHEAVIPQISYKKCAQIYLDETKKFIKSLKIKNIEKFFNTSNVEDPEVWFAENFGTKNAISLCLHHPEKNVCYGDSGSPIIYKGNSPDKDMLLGIVSFGVPGCPRGAPSISGRIDAFKPWINAVLEGKEAPYERDLGFDEHAHSEKREVQSYFLMRGYGARSMFLTGGGFLLLLGGGWWMTFKLVENPVASVTERNEDVNEKVLDIPEAEIKEMKEKEERKQAKRLSTKSNMKI